MKLVSLIWIAATVAALLPAPASAQDHLSLAQGPSDLAPTAYLALRQRADSAFAGGRFAEAAVAYERLSRAYPWDGEQWRRLGIAHYQTGNWIAAARALSEADRLGILPYPQHSAVVTARSYLRAGEPDSAAAWLERAMLVHRYDRVPQLLADTSFLPLHGQPRHSRLLGAHSGGATSRDEAWRQDLAYLLAEVRRMNATWRGALPTAMELEAKALHDAIPGLSDIQIQVGMQRLLAGMGQSHNNVFIRAPQLPVTLYAFADGVYIVNADSAHASLVGMRVERIGARPVDEVFAALQAITTRDHSMNGWVFADAAAQPGILHALGLIDRPDSVRLTLADRQGRMSVRTLGAQTTFRSSRRLLPPPARAVTSSAPTPLWLSRTDDFHWFTPVPGTSAVYVQFNQVANKPDESLAQFGLRLRRFLAEHDARQLIVDVRLNNGGNTYLYPELLRTLIAFDAREGTQLFVLVGRFTYSAAMNFVTDLDRLSNAVFVGEPSGGTPIQLGGDESMTVLPNSGIEAALSSAVWQLTSPRDTRAFIVPQFPVALTAADYFANHDSVLEALRSLLTPSGAP